MYPRSNDHLWRSRQVPRTSASQTSAISMPLDAIFALSAYVCTLNVGDCFLFARTSSSYHHEPQHRHQHRTVIYFGERPRTQRDQVIDGALILPTSTPHVISLILFRPDLNNLPRAIKLAILTNCSFSARQVSCVMRCCPRHRERPGAVVTPGGRCWQERGRRI